MTPWHELPPHIKITYQSQAQYERQAEGEAARFTDASGSPLTFHDFSDEQLRTLAEILDMPSDEAASK